VPEAMQVFFRTIRGKPETPETPQMTETANQGKSREICNCDVGQKAQQHLCLN